MISPASIQLLEASGNKLVQQIGIGVIKGVVYDVLTGKNLRDSTEVLTRRRVATLNLAITEMFIKGSSAQDDFLAQLPKLATEILQQKGNSKAERWMAQWLLGLNDKAFQNVLRDNPDALSNYREWYIKTCQEVVDNYQRESGTLTGELRLQSGDVAKINWLFLLYLSNTIGAQTLAIRGSEKSTYGKLFEKLILGSLLHILGFKLVNEDNPDRLRRVFWLSSRKEKRESDATVLYEAGKGVRIDIGFIGRGNPEISLDKVSRFEKEISFRSSKWYLATIIIVDRIGANSRIEELAKRIDGTIIQMSMGYWPKQVAEELKKVLGYKSEILGIKSSELGKYLRKKLDTVPLKEFIGLELDKENGVSP